MGKALQFNCLTDLREVISQLDGYFARPTPRGTHPTIYADRDDGPYRTVMGIRVCDYKLSPDGQWVLPDSQMGLSFSSTWQHLENAHKMASRIFGKPVDIFLGTI
ncbi:hypothetical protein [uncultured Microbulbifer sp.]|uniref:hypothetical protein n=1 Tax=uncultured Microbulbifer sp. TaxID=348147 RepID=UPI002629B03C|nr:hypothetical protein [uncultured Microbulbifer sp.]